MTIKAGLFFFCSLSLCSFIHAMEMRSLCDGKVTTNIKVTDITHLTINDILYVNILDTTQLLDNTISGSSDLNLIIKVPINQEKEVYDALTVQGFKSFTINNTIIHQEPEEMIDDEPNHTQAKQRVKKLLGRTAIKKSV